VSDAPLADDEFAKLSQRVAADVIGALHDLSHEQLLDVARCTSVCLSVLPSDEHLLRLRGRINGEMKRRAKTTPIS
jgi:hypothetical protein